MLKKKHLIYIGLLGIILFFVLSFSKEIGICPLDNYSSCLNLSNQAAEILLPVFPVFLLALVTYFMREEIYNAWFKFARWWIPLSMFLILITPEYGGGLFNPIQKGSVAVVTSLLFFIISLIIVAVKYLRLRT